MATTTASSILAERDLTAAEREAVADEPRVGVWVEREGQGDRRQLSQDETDQLIRCELARFFFTDSPEVATLMKLGSIEPCRLKGNDDAFAQRGGIHSEPLVRLLAYRAWGDRDRRWFTFGFDEIQTWREPDGEFAIACRFGEHRVTERISQYVLHTTSDPKRLVEQTIGKIGRQLGVEHPNLPRERFPVRGIG